MAKPRIPIVEDEPGIADTLQYALRTEGFEPLWVATGEAALAQARSGKRRSTRREFRPHRRRPRQDAARQTRARGAGARSDPHPPRRHRESAEASLVEIAQSLATPTEHASREGALRTEALQPLFESVYARRFTRCVTHSPGAAAPGQRIEVDDDGAELVVQGDAFLLHRALCNLVANALSFIKEIAQLHFGRATLRNGADRGAVATLSLPLADASDSPAPRR